MLAQDTLLKPVVEVMPHHFADNDGNYRCEMEEKDLLHSTAIACGFCGDDKEMAKVVLMSTTHAKVRTKDMQTTNAGILNNQNSKRSVDSSRVLV